MKLVTALIVAIIVSFSAFAQYTNTALTKADVISIIKEANTNMPALKEAAGWGNQIATALKGCVTALNDGVTVTTDQIYKFSGSGIGKVTVTILVYKIIGKEIIRMIVAFILMFVVTKYFTKGMKYFFGPSGKTEGESVFSYMNKGYSCDGTFILIASGVAYIVCIIALTALAFC